MFKRKKFIIWIIIFFVIIVSAYFIFREKDSSDIYTTTSVEKGELLQTVSSTGDLTDEREITLNFEIGGRIGKIFVKEGQMVAAGDSIAMIDNPILASQATQAKANLDLAVAKAGGTNDAIREAEVAVDNAKNIFEETKDLNSKNESAAEQSMEDAKDYLEDARIYYNHIVLDKGLNSFEAESAKLTLRTAERSYNAAKEAVEVTKKQSDLSEASAENSVDISKARLKTLESKFTENSNDASILAARASYDIATENMSKATLKSSVNGTITKINNKVGEILGTGVIKESFTKVITNDFILESNIPESDIVKIVLGDKAKVTFDALNPDDIFSGEVVQIDTDATVIQDVVYYRIKLRLDNFDKRLKPGMNANIDIMTARKDDVMKIPSRAIKNENNKKYVEVLKDENQIEKIFVQTGLEGDEGMVEILAGLKGDEKVITFVQKK